MEIRGLVADVERAGSGAQPECLEREEHEHWSGEFRDGRGEAFRRLAHGDVNGGQEDQPEREERNNNPAEMFASI